jgi:hypothetical protein
MANTFPRNHSHVFLGEGHARNERRIRMVIALCTVMMIAEIVGGLFFGSSSKSKCRALRLRSFFSLRPPEMNWNNSILCHHSNFS